MFVLHGYNLKFRKCYVIEFMYACMFGLCIVRLGYFFEQAVLLSKAKTDMAFLMKTSNENKFHPYR